MNSPKIIESTNRLATQTADARVVVLTQMDYFTKTSTATIRRDMAESVKKDVKILKKFELFTTV